MQIKPGTIAGDNLDSRPARKLPRNTVGVTVGNYIKRAIALRIAHDRSISLAATPGPVIDADNGRNNNLRQGGRANHSEQGVSPLTDIASLCDKRELPNRLQSAESGCASCSPKIRRSSAHIGEFVGEGECSALAETEKTIRHSAPSAVIA